MYISDLDGTLLNRGAELSERSRDALNRVIAAGHCFSIATARTAATAVRIMEGVNLNLPVVLMNGVAIYDTARRKYISATPVPAEVSRGVIAAMNRLGMGRACMMYEIRDGKLECYYESLEHVPIRDFVNDRIKRYNKVFRQAESFSDVKPGNIAYFTFLDTHERLSPVLDSISGLPVSAALYPDNYSDLWYLEVFSESASKRSAVVRLREMFGFGRVVCFGDNLNDLPMFEACDVRIAPQNARPEVLACADIVCGGNDADGVANWLLKNLP